MSRFTKKSCMVALAAFFCSAAMVSAAGAASFHAEKEPVTYQGTGASTQFSFQHSPSSFTFNCSVTGFTSDSTSKVASALYLHPDFRNCPVNGVSAVVSVPPTCMFRIAFGKTGPAMFSAVGCGDSTSGGITITTTGCTYRIGDQTSREGVTLVNEGSGNQRAIAMSLQLTKLKFSQSSGCSGGPGISETLNLSTGATLKGHESTFGTNTGVWVE